jgi:hypothetical protein
MSFITQYIINRGISEDMFILILAIPIIFVVITFVRRIIGSITLGIYTPLLLILLLTVVGIKDGVILFVFVFISMFVVRYFLKKITFLIMTDMRVLDATMFCVLTIVIILGFLYIPLLKDIPLNMVTLLLLLVMSSCSQDLIMMWESRGFKRFVSPIVEILALVTVSYFLINWTWIQNIILKYPLAIIIVSVLVIAFLSRWKKLKIKEYIRFREVIKHVELPEKK